RGHWPHGRLGPWGARSASPRPAHAVPGCCWARARPGYPDERSCRRRLGRVGPAEPAAQGGHPQRARLHSQGAEGQDRRGDPRPAKVDGQTATPPEDRRHQGRLGVVDIQEGAGKRWQARDPHRRPQAHAAAVPGRQHRAQRRPHRGRPRRQGTPDAAQGDLGQDLHQGESCRGHPRQRLLPLEADPRPGRGPQHGLVADGAAEEEARGGGVSEQRAPGPADGVQRAGEAAGGGDAPHEAAAPHRRARRGRAAGAARQAQRRRRRVRAGGIPQPHRPVRRAGGGALLARGRRARAARPRSGHGVPQAVLQGHAADRDARGGLLGPHVDQELPARLRHHGQRGVRAAADRAVVAERPAGEPAEERGRRPAAHVHPRRAQPADGLHQGLPAALQGPAEPRRADHPREGGGDQQGRPPPGRAPQRPALPDGGDGPDLHGSTTARFWRWDKTVVWEASSGIAAGGAEGAPKMDVAELCDKLFQGSARKDAYKRLLLEMFETFESFEAQMLTGGFGGSAVVRVQPYEREGRPSEPCVVKLDTGKLIRDEFQKSVNVFAALPDRAARILGDPVFSAGEEFGAMRLELAGACWNNPELAQGSSSSNLLSTFKDLLLYESEQALLGVSSSPAAAENRPFGNVNSVIAETFGPGGVVSSLRKGDRGLHRSEGTPLLWGWYTLKGKPGPFNLYTAAKGEYPAEPAMRRLYKEYFRAELPSMKDLGIDSIKEKLISLAGQGGKELAPLVGLAHGDLNAANIMIDASDALWLIDFATSVDLPLFTDMCKFEMACLFEYAAIPITPKMLVEFAGTQESLWKTLNVGDWLRTDQAVVVMLLQKFVALPPERLAGLSQGDLEQLIDEVVKRTSKSLDKQHKMERSLKSRLVADEAMVAAAFTYCSSVSNALLRGDTLGETLNVSAVPLPEGRGGRGALSLKLLMDHCVAVRRFMRQDVVGCMRDRAGAQADLQPCDWMSLQLYLPFLRESYRIIGYRDVAPQYKIWAIYHCSKLAQCVQHSLGVVSKNARKLEKAGYLSALRAEMDSSVKKHRTEKPSPLGDATVPETLSAEMFQEETERFKQTLRARLSFIIDPLSGDRLSVRECAPPSLTQLGPRFGLGGGSKSPPVRSTGSAGSAGAEEGATAGARRGWANIMGVAERLDRGTPSGTPSAFLVLGPPGSGKTCLVHRLIMEVLDRYTHVVPLLLPVADLVKRSSQDPELCMVDKHHSTDEGAVDRWFDKYLRITFGEDSHRYLMICRAIKTKHVMLIFEGLEDCGELKPCIERCIQRQILQQRMVVVTSRPLIGGQSSLEEIEDSIVAMNVESLTEEHIRMVAHARLGLSGFDAFERIFAKVRGGGGGEPHGEQGEGSDGKPEVFGNPMMLSMLLCYLQTMKRKEAEKREAQRRGQADDNEDEGEGTNITAIYRVAIDVMLMRMQRRQMADRLNQQEELDRWKQIVEVVALHMALRGLDSITAAEAEALLRGQLRREWPSLKKAVVAGHAMFLRVTDGAREEMQFLAKDFLSFFAASAVARGGGYELPGVAQLLGDPAWAQMLEMLSEAWPLQYVRVVEHRLGSFRGEGGDGFLHVAARAGHHPAFQCLRLFSDRNRKALKIQNQDMQTPLHVAAERGYTGLCALMLDGGAPAEALDSKERLAIHVAMQHGNFQTAKFLTQHWSRQEHLAAQLYSRKSRGHAEQLASRVLGELSGRSAPRAAEGDFLQIADSLFMELGYFGLGEADVRKSTLCALLAVFWVAADHYELFVRGQPEGERLTPPSWEKLQEWAKRTVCLTGSTSMLSTTLVFVAIMNLSRIKSFRQAFAPDVDEPDEALAAILQKSPILVPSFMKLNEHQRQAILSALKANFNFGQFLQAENLPGNLSAAKQILMESGNTSGSVNTLGLFLFRNFAALSGLRGKDSLEGSLFMTDEFYSNYKVGLDVLKHLMRESAQQVYERFLKERARAQALSFYPHDPASRARVRLACLARVFDAEGGREVSEALAGMEPGQRRSLIHFLNADGIDQKPGFLLYFAPHVLANARRNPSIGLTLGLEMLVTVYEAAAREYVDSEQTVVTVMLPELVERALSCADAESFRCAKFEIARTSDSVGTLRMSPWQVWNDPRALELLSADARALVDGVLGSRVREPAFLKRLPQAFPELQFFSGEEGAAQKGALREAQLALLTVYWAASNQLESFNRGQEASVKLSAKAWGKIRQLAGPRGLTDPETVEALLVTAALHSLGRIPKLGAHLAPDADSHRRVIAQILDSSPKVLPSYWRLRPRYRKVVQCLLSLRLFDFRQFLDAESVPASLAAIKAMLGSADCAGELTSAQVLRLFMFMVFVEMAAASAEQSLEGSVCMTSRLWSELEVGLDALEMLQGEGEVAIYNRSLQLTSSMLHLDFDAASQESRAVARVARLAAATSPGLAGKVREAFGQLSGAEGSALARYLTADGIAVKPGFVLAGGRALLSNALSNTMVGILPALRILLQVHREAEKHFRWSSCSVLTIDLVKLAVFTQDFAGSVTFQEISFDVVKSGSTEVVVVPTVWIPVRNPSVLNTLRMQSRDLASDALANKISEAQFKARLERTFPELSYFNAGGSEQLPKTICAMMSVYWCVTGQHEAFTRGQADNELLSRHSWSWIQGWMKQSVRLMSEEALDAMLTFVAISALGTIPQFREEFAPRVSARIHDAVLAHVLETRPEVVPSFQRLPARYRGLLSDCLRVNFRFSEFLMAEGVPANLAHVKASMEPHGEEGIAFFCFRIFSRACGKLGSRHAQGSQFMTEPQFQRFRPGLEALQQLRTLDAGAAYNNYILLLQGSKALACFTSPEHQALTRLLCLESAGGEASESAVSDAFKELHPRERARLTRLLTADGLGERPGFVLRGAPELLRAACSNPRVGAPAVLRTLLRVQDKCSVGSRVRKVHLDMHGLVAAARDAQGPREFTQLPLDLRYDDQGDTRVCVVAVAGASRSETALTWSAARSQRGSEVATGGGGDGGSLFWRLLGGMSCRSAPAVSVEREDA
ncbi:unnamed protein product, partial [Prorocentrum cordatum]